MEKRKSRRKWAIVVVAVLFIVFLMMFSAFAIIPYVYGPNFVSLSAEVDGPTPFATVTMKVILPDGKNGSCYYINYVIKWTNTYFWPVQIHFNGMHDVMLVYNHTVQNPADIIINREHLVWGAFFPLGSFPRSLEDKNEYNYYVERMNLSNYTMAFGSGHGGWCSPFYYGIANSVVWHGQDLNGNPVQPGTYYLYFIGAGVVASPKPAVVTITEVYRK